MTEYEKQSIRLLKILVKLLMAQPLEAILRDKKNRQIYELTGEKTQAEIIKKLNISPNKLSDLWNDWERKGLTEKDGRQFKKVKIDD